VRVLAALCVASLVLLPARARAEEGAVLLSKSAALRVVFPGCDRALEVRRLLTTDEKRDLEKTLHRPLEEKGFLVYLGLHGEDLDGFAVITNEIGKTEPITFIVGVNRDGTVRRVAVMVYRESHGGEVETRRFLSQFERKSLADPIELHRDVINVSGATLSATAMCNGTRKVLAAVQQLYLRRSASDVLEEARKSGAREFALLDEPADRATTTATSPPAPAPSSKQKPAAALRPSVVPLPLVAARRLVMGSELGVTARTALPDALERIHAAIDAADRLDATLSDWRDESELSRVNREAGRAPISVGDAMLDFLVQSRALWKETDGAFDPSIGELVRAWGFRGGAPHRPSPAELAELVAGSGFAGVALDETARTVRFTRPRVRLDPGAIGKGIAVDAVLASLKERGIDDAIVDFGSTQRAMGGGEDGLGWPVGLRDPAAPDSVTDVIFLRDHSCSTSGGTEKWVEIDGERVGHILDPRTGIPASGCSAATVLASTGARSDALATAVCVLGPVEGARRIERIADAAAAILPAASARAASGAVESTAVRPDLVKTSRWPGATDAGVR
jgi:thiamine biosynthesis lipoprotein